MVAILDAAASAEEESIAEFLKPHLDNLVARLEEDSDVQEILRIRAGRAAKREGKLSPIGPRQRSGGGT
jgi:hypothetical protein